MSEISVNAKDTDGDVEKIEIPSTVSHMENLYTVTRIGQSAFVK